LLTKTVFTNIADTEVHSQFQMEAYGVVVNWALLLVVLAMVQQGLMVFP